MSATERRAGDAAFAAPSGGRCRVLFVITSSDVGGAENVLLETVTRLDRSRFEPTVCSLRPCGRVAKKLAAAGVAVRTLDMSYEPRLAELVTGTRTLRRWIDELSVDIVQASLYRANVLSRIAARLSRRRPAVISGQHGLGPLGGRKASVASRLTRGWSDRFVVVSASVGEALVRAEGVRRDRVVLIGNGVDVQRFRPRDRSALRVGKGVPAEAFVIGCVGRLSPEKGVDRLLESVATVHERGVAAYVLVAGSGPEQSRLEALARTLGIGSHVRFLGAVSDPSWIYSAVDVFVLPSTEEGSPMALMEAMASGCAAVATRVGGVPEIVEDGRSGLLVDAGPTAEIAAALVRLIEDPALRARLGGNARRRVVESFDVAGMVQRHVALYGELMAERRRA